MAGAADVEYVVAWIVYALAGGGLTLVWFRITRHVRHSGWRDLLRGLAIVLIFTPWTPPGTTVYAPATLVLLMGLTFEGTDSSFASGVALLVSAFLMLVVLTIRQVRRSRPVR
ncbi:MAG: hypothetical protein CMQ24_21360 [Gammaproteobacteria bacterium]|nr:hypothetical protein [Gammaproteobacteria bacterium]